MIATKLRSRGSIFRRLSPAVASLTAITLLLAGVAIILYGERTYRAQKFDEAAVQAQILASTVTAALIFDDRKTAEEYVGALKANSEVRAAALYDASGALFVSYRRDADTPLPAAPPTRQPHIQGDRLSVVMPITQDASHLGTIYIQTLIEPIANRLLRYGLIALLATMGSLIILVLESAQRAQAKANAELASRAADLAVVNERLETQIGEREQVEAALRQAQKMEAIGRLTGGVAHDFNNLLTVIIGNLDLIRGNSVDEERVVRLADGATLAAERGARLIKQLLMFARRQPLNPENVDPNRLIADFESLMRRAAGANVDIMTNLSSAPGPVRIDSTQFESAILNLVVNANEAISGKGQITIETRTVELGRETTPDGQEIAAGRYVMVAVSDTGRGIPADRLPRVFDPFFTTKEVGQGSGLGLSQVYGFAKESGGHVTIESAVGVGTTVKLYLPCSNGSEIAGAAEKNTARLTRISDSVTVLVVEDEGTVLDIAVESIRQLGYRVLTACDAGRALEILRSEEPVEILFSDVVMPGDMNGAQLAMVAASLRPSIKILLTSGYPASALAAQHGLRQGIPLLQKPYRAQELATQLRVISNAA